MSSAESFIDLLRAADNSDLDASMRALKMLSLRDRHESRQTRELKEEFPEHAGTEIPRMVHVTASKLPFTPPSLATAEAA